MREEENLVETLNCDELCALKEKRELKKKKRSKAKKEMIDNKIMDKMCGS